jgi:glycosyltransferase involved in cell wall biosynthesis
MVRYVLMVAFHFPPMHGSSGIQRTLCFARDLRGFGWNPIVLSAHPRAYERVSQDQMADIPPDVPVVRALAWDTARHLAIGGRYAGALARPDRWVSWRLAAVPAGLAAIRRYRPSLVWSTYPIATAHVIGAALQRRSGLPWVADFRDPMAQEGYPEDPATWRSFDAVERATVTNACLSTFTSPGALATYRRRYPDVAQRLLLLENGYDEESFSGVTGAGPLNPGKLTLLHSGVVYASERDPSALFAALRTIKERAPRAYGCMRLRFRAAVHDDLLREAAHRHAVEDAVELLPLVGYREALAEMLSADGLLVLQAANCNAQIPAKLYEYLRARRPIVALTDRAGDTASVLRAAGIDAIAPLDDPAAIADALEAFVAVPSTRTRATEDAVMRASRRRRAEELAQLFDRAAGMRAQRQDAA